MLIVRTTTLPASGERSCSHGMPQVVGVPELLPRIMRATGSIANARATAALIRSPLHV